MEVESPDSAHFDQTPDNTVGRVVASYDPLRNIETPVPLENNTPTVEQIATQSRQVTASLTISNYDQLHQNSVSHSTDPTIVTSHNPHFSTFYADYAREFTFSKRTLGDLLDELFPKFCCIGDVFHRLLQDRFEYWIAFEFVIALIATLVWIFAGNYNDKYDSVDFIVDVLLVLLYLGGYPWAFILNVDLLLDLMRRVEYYFVFMNLVCSIFLLRSLTDLGASQVLRGIAQLPLVFVIMSLDAIPREVLTPKRRLATYGLLCFGLLMTYLHVFFNAFGGDTYDRKKTISIVFLGHDIHIIDALRSCVINLMIFFMKYFVCTIMYPTVMIMIYPCFYDSEVQRLKTGRAVERDPNVFPRTKTEVQVRGRFPYRPGTVYSNDPSEYVTFTSKQTDDFQRMKTDGISPEVCFQNQV